MRCFGTSFFTFLGRLPDFTPSIKRSVQAQYNTEASYLAAQAVSARKGAAEEIEAEQRAAVDPMAAAEREAIGAKGPAFVAAKDRTTVQQSQENGMTARGNADEIQIDDDDL